MIPAEAFKNILEELESRPITVNHYRDTAGVGRSQTFGTVNKRCLPVDYSRQNWLRPKLLFHLQEFAERYVDIPWTSITVNQNYSCGKHRDKGNKGESFLVAFGTYSGGDLLIHEGDLSGNHNICHRPIKTDFSKVLHSVAPFTGNRYSLVFYTLKSTKMPLTPLPPGRAVFEGGRYVFKRGDSIITSRTGLPHPLRGRTKTKEKPSAVSNIQTDDGFVVTFD